MSQNRDSSRILCERQTMDFFVLLTHGYNAIFLVPKSLANFANKRHTVTSAHKVVTSWRILEMLLLLKACLCHCHAGALDNLEITDSFYRFFVALIVSVLIVITMNALLTTYSQVNFYLIKFISILYFQNIWHFHSVLLILQKQHNIKLLTRDKVVKQTAN